LISRICDGRISVNIIAGYPGGICRTFVVNTSAIIAGIRNCILCNFIILNIYRTGAIIIIKINTPAISISRAISRYYITFNFTAISLIIIDSNTAAWIAAAGSVFINIISFNKTVSVYGVNKYTAAICGYDIIFYTCNIIYIVNIDSPVSIFSYDIIKKPAITTAIRYPGIITFYSVIKYIVITRFTINCTVSRIFNRKALNYSVINAEIIIFAIKINNSITRACSLEINLILYTLNGCVREIRTDTILIISCRYIDLYPVMKLTSPWSNNFLRSVPVI